jgi:hypothetical protein
MPWVKRGLIYRPDGTIEWMRSHAAIPFAEPTADGNLRIYFSSRDAAGRSRPAFLEVDGEDPGRVLRVSSEPLFPLGPLGSFDDNGIMPSSVVRYQGRKYLYYIGWNPQVTVSYRLSVGLAICDSLEGTEFRRAGDGPVLDRTFDEPYFNTAPYVIHDDRVGLWRMWNICCTRWEMIQGRAEPHYHIRTRESVDGVHWSSPGIVCVDYDDFANAFGRPSVWLEDGRYRMMYSYRSATGYRTERGSAYRFGYAESADGKSWDRRDAAVGIAASVDESAWDSQMVEYGHVFQHGERRLLFYNGNGFGQSGFGWAEWQP